MSEEKKILNKGLDALLGQSNSNQRSVKEIGLDKIKPGRFQPRSNFDDEKLQELTASIKNQGCLLYTSPSPRDATLSRMPSSA